MEKRTDALTEEQKQALRYALTMTSEQIAPLLGISKKAVDKRIDAARARLNGMSRRQAADLLAREEGRLSDRTGDNVLPLTIPLDPKPEAPAFDLSSDANGGTGDFTSSDPKVGQRRNSLDPWQRLGVMILLMALLAAGSAAYVYSLHLR